MIKSPKFSIEEITKIVESEEVLPLDTKEDIDDMNTCMNLISKRLETKLTADHEEFILEMLRHVIVTLKQNIIERFEKIRDEKL